MKRVTVLSIGVMTGWLAILASSGVMSAAPAWRERKKVEQRAAEYVAAYQQQLTAIVADEAYVQTVRHEALEAGTRSRSTTGEVFFIFSAPGRGWMAIRDVQTVDGAPAAQRTDVRQILRTLPAAQVGDRMRSYNARFNIGRITRNINEPTLALLALDEGHRSRFRFSSRERETRAGRDMVRLAFQERERPTLIRGADGGPIFVKGGLLVEASTGRIWESRLTMTVDRINVELTTDYAFHERLDLMIPTVFRERYDREKTAASYEQIVCEATYSNFRRFEVLTRVR
jgi:hypothetical protein